MKIPKLSKSEQEIMDVLWAEGRPLSRAEILELSTEKSWKPSSIHILLNSMLEKNAIEVAGFVQSTKNYARTFVPCVSSDDYAIMQIKSSPTFSQNSVPSLVTALVEDVTELDILGQLEDIIKTRRKEL